MGFFDSLSGAGSQRKKAMLHYKRGMAKARKHDNQGAILDYTATIDMTDVPPDLLAMALYNRSLVLAATGDKSKALEDLKSVLAMPEVPEKVKAAADEKMRRMSRRAGSSRPAE